ncbi:MAG TPA: hypothetical protein DCZ49_05860 [Hyphomonadaceae bacterium]|nr:hypothetical protein [Hyphomonadaceae bacterium]
MTQAPQKPTPASPVQAPARLRVVAIGLALASSLALGGYVYAQQQGGGSGDGAGPTHPTLPPGARNPGRAPTPVVPPRAAPAPQVPDSQTAPELDAAPEVDRSPRVVPDNRGNALAAGQARVDQLERLFRSVVGEVRRDGNVMTMQIEGIDVTVVTDPAAGRMRIVAPVAPQSALNAGLMTRILQANFESALDARYAIAQGALWATFIHPLLPLTDEQAVDGLGQTVTLVLTFGSSFSSGGLSFGGGDNSNALVEELRRRQRDFDESI